MCSLVRTLLALATMTACGPVRETIVTVDADPALSATADLLRVEVIDPSGNPIAQELRAPVGQLDLPFRFRLESDAEPARQANVIVTLMSGAAISGVQQALVVAPSGTSFLPICFRQICAGNVCSSGQTCVDSGIGFAGCAPANVQARPTDQPSPCSASSGDVTCCFNNTSYVCPDATCGPYYRCTDGCAMFDSACREACRANHPLGIPSECTVVGACG